MRQAGCFNPRPPFRAGATLFRNHCLSPMPVSILARPFERALPIAQQRAEGTITFQSSPALSSGRYMPGRRGQPLEAVFQSSPALSSGRYAGGDCARGGIAVSILARPFERALPSAWSAPTWPTAFQSSPALSSGRYRATLNAPVSSALAGCLREPQLKSLRVEAFWPLESRKVLS